MQPNVRAIILVAIAAFLSAVAQLFFKYASGNLSLDVFALITNIELILGFVFYGLAAVLFIIGLKDGELTVLYPILATTFIWVAIASPLIFLTDSLNALKILGTATIIVGITFIARGMQHKVEVV